MLLPLFPLPLTVTMFEVMAAWMISDWILEGGDMDMDTCVIKQTLIVLSLLNLGLICYRA